MDITTQKTKRDLYSLLFHYNFYIGKWACFRNEDKANYFNGSGSIYPIGRGDTVEEAYKDYANWVEADIEGLVNG
tara:strand:+ start:256 stop:480 length:225 start_codon:yes stop_codon:yes gene_type:complete